MSFLTTNFSVQVCQQYGNFFVFFNKVWSIIMNKKTIVCFVNIIDSIESTFEINDPEKLENTIQYLSTQRRQ